MRRSPVSKELKATVVLFVREQIKKMKAGEIERFPSNAEITRTFGIGSSGTVNRWLERELKAEEYRYWQNPSSDNSVLCGTARDHDLGAVALNHLSDLESDVSVRIENKVAFCVQVRKELTAYFKSDCKDLSTLSSTKALMEKFGIIGTTNVFRWLRKCGLFTLHELRARRSAMHRLGHNPVLREETDGESMNAIVAIPSHTSLSRAKQEADIPVLNDFLNSKARIDRLVEKIGTIEKIAFETSFQKIARLKTMLEPIAKGFVSQLTFPKTEKTYFIEGIIFFAKILTDSFDVGNRATVVVLRQWGLLSVYAFKDEHPQSQQNDDYHYCEFCDCINLDRSYYSQRLCAELFTHGMNSVTVEQCITDQLQQAEEHNRQVEVSLEERLATFEKILKAAYYEE